jgi:hypothetical protein
MKKISSILIMCIYTIICSAQIQIAETGNVAIGDTLSSDIKLFVNTPDSHGTGIYSLVESRKMNTIAISGEAHGAIDTQIAVMGRSTNYLYNTGRAFGVMGIAGNRKAGYNYGVFGGLEGNRNGAGIFGTASTALIPQMNGKYAGYFFGDVYITGTLTAAETTTMSDARYKSNIQPVNTTALAKISALNPVQYTMLSGEAIALANSEMSDTTSISTITISDDELARINKIHYGLLAQEVKELYPELVHEDAAGVMSINYIELIPLLIQAVQDLSEQVKTLSNALNTSNNLQTQVDAIVNN